MVFIKAHRNHFPSEQKMFIAPKHTPLVRGSAILNRGMRLVMLSTGNKYADVTDNDNYNHYNITMFIIIVIIIVAVIFFIFIFITRHFVV